MKEPDENPPADAGVILLVDDLPNWRETLEEILTSDGQIVYTTAYPSKALEIVAEKPVDVAVLDLRLDDKDIYNVRGLHILGEIRAIRPRTRILMMTGFPSSRLLDKIPAVYDVDAFWLKNPPDHPFDIDRFRQEVRLLVKAARSSR